MLGAVRGRNDRSVMNQSLDYPSHPLDLGIPIQYGPLLICERKRDFRPIKSFNVIPVAEPGKQIAAAEGATAPQRYIVLLAAPCVQ